MPDKYDIYTESTPATYETDITKNLRKSRKNQRFTSNLKNGKDG